MYVIPGATTLTIERNTLKNTIDQSKWEFKNVSEATERQGGKIRKNERANRKENKKIA